jgi:glycolate oxidase iron-sulfur subunit
VDAPRYEDYSRCVHCGLCLNHCPTYRLLGVEMDSPRGRIHQMILVDEGRLQLAESFVRHIDLCLDCRACETACPSGVEYGKLVEAARAQIERHHRRPRASRFLRWLGFQQILPRPARLALVGRLLRFYQRSALRKVAQASGLWRLFPKLREAESLLPPIDDNFFFSELGRVFPAEGERRARVAFFAGCMQQVCFSELNRATLRVLQKNGCEVVVPAGQVCCGALHVHAGVRDTARRLAQTNLDAFLGESGLDAILTNTAGCGSTLKEYDQLFLNDPAACAKAELFRSKVQDVTEFLAALGLRPPSKAAPIRVTYQDSCHLVHGQRIKTAPRQLLAGIPGLELVEMKLADQCCGSAGIYNLTQPEVARALLKEKMQHARATGAPVIATANPGCILQLRAGAAQHNTGQEVLHVIELLDRAYGLDSMSRARAQKGVPLRLWEQVTEGLSSYKLKIIRPRPYFAELAYYLWGEVNYDSQGDCERPTDRGWSYLILTNRETGEQIYVRGEQDSFVVRSPNSQLAARTAVFLSERTGGEFIEADPQEGVGQWNHHLALERALPVREEFERPELQPFDSAVFWGSWKWIGLFASEFTWTGRCIMHSVPRRDKRAVYLCAFWLREGTVSPQQSAALRYALECLTDQEFPTDREWVEWYFRGGGLQAFPEPDFDAWVREEREKQTNRGK